MRMLKIDLLVVRYYAVVLLVINISTVESSVTFLTSPIVGISSSGKLQVSGCKYSSPFEYIDPRYTYYELTNSLGSFTFLSTTPVGVRRRSIEASILPSVEITSFEQFGTYRCVVYDPEQMEIPVYSNATTTSAFLPIFERNPVKVIQVSIGEYLEVPTCRFQAPFINGLAGYWTKNGKLYRSSVLKDVTALTIKPIDPPIETGLRTYELQQRIIIESASLGDSGVYSCVLQFNSSSKIPNHIPRNFSRDVANVTIKYLTPEFTDVPKLEIRVSELGILGCRYLSSIRYSDEYTYLLVNGSRTNLPLFPIRPLKRRRALEQDEMIFPGYLINSYNLTGYYQCSIFDPNNMLVPVVSNKSAFISFPVPKLQLNSKNSILEVTVGSSFRLPNCDVDSKIPIKEHEYYWMKDGKQKIFVNTTKLIIPDGIPTCCVIPDDRDGTTRSLVPGFPPLTFDRITFADSGRYQCAVHPDGLYQILSTTVHLKVKEIKPTFTGGPRFQTSESVYIITGCTYNSSMDFQRYSYVMINGTRSSLNPLVTPNRTSGAVENVYNLFPYQITSYNLSGYYQCAIFNPETMLKPVVSPTSSFISIPKLNVEFLSKPELQVTNDSINVIGCKLKVFSNLPFNVYVEYNGIAYHGNKSYLKTNASSALEYQLTSKRISNYKELSYQYRCVVEDAFITTEKSYSERNNRFDAVPGILPVFTKGPDAAYGNRTGGFLRIFGCHVSSKVSLDGAKAYWLRNNYERVPVQLDQTEGEGKLFNYRFRSIYNRTGSNYMYHGFYQCLLVLPDFSQTQVLSKETIDVQFKDISTTSVTISMNKKWSQKLEDRNSEEYKSLKEEIISNLKVKLRKMNSNAVIRFLGFSSGSVIANTQILFLNVQQEERRKECENVNEISNQVKIIQGLDILTVVSKNLDCCVEDTQGEIPFKGQYNYSKTLESTNAVNKCTYSKDAKFTRKCKGNLKTGPQWSTVLLENCPAKTKTTNDLIQLSKVSICSTSNNTGDGCGTSLEVAKNLSSIVSQNNSITIRQDVFYIETIIRHITDAPSTFTGNQSDEVIQISNDIISTVSELVAADRNIVTEAEIYTQSATEILLLLDEFAEKLGEIVKILKKPISVGRKNAAFIIKYVEPSYVNVIIDKGKKDNVLIKMEQIESSPTDNVLPNAHLSSAAIPREAFEMNSKIVHSFYYKFDTLFQTKKDLEKRGSPLVQSNVLAVTVGGKKITNLTEPVTLKFRKVNEFELPKNIQSESICTFWRFRNTTGKWSTEGCRRIGETSEYIECQCDHLTNFAILLDVSQTQGSTLELEIFTWIGCGISLAGLLATFLTFLVFRNLRKKLPPKILIFLTLSLMCLLVVFLAGVDAESIDSHRGCQVVAGLIQYFTLTSFFWMAIEGINLYRNFVKIFRDGSEQRFLKTACLFAWGLPIIIVVICGFLSPDNFGGERYCVVRGEVFYFGTLVPVAVILFGNFIVLFLVMRSLGNTNRAMITSKKTKEIRSQMRIAFACAVLLGLTWLFGLFAVGDLREVFQWLFTIFNSLQGLFIFILYTLRNKDARREWKNFFCCRSSRSGGTSSNSQTNTDKTGSLPLKTNSGNKDTF